jgi:hypothetical protein
MKTIHIKEDNVLVKRYMTNDGKVYDTKDEAVDHERREKIKLKIKTAYATVFENSDEVVESILEGLYRMLECDRKIVLNGLINLTIDRKPRKKASVEASA